MEIILENSRHMHLESSLICSIFLFVLCSNYLCCIIKHYCLRILFAVKRHHGNGNSYKGHLIGVGLQFRGLIHYLHGGKHDSVQADMVLDKELGVSTFSLAGRKKRAVLSF